MEEDSREFFKKHIDDMNWLFFHTMLDDYKKEVLNKIKK